MTSEHPMNHALDDWIDLRIGATHGKLSVWTLYQAAKSGRLRHVRVGGRRTIRTTRRWVDEWLRRYEVGGSLRADPSAGLEDSDEVRPAR